MRMSIILVTSCLFAVAQASEYEDPPTVSADVLFPDLPLTGDHYQVQAEVPTDGFLTRAVID